MKSKSHPTRTIVLAAGLAVASLFLAGCGSEEPAESAETEGLDPRIDGVLLEDAPAGAVSVTELRKGAEPGAEVAVIGRVAGAREPFAEGFASLVLADASLETCERIPGDTCPTPWDACCVAPEELQASRLSVQVRGEEARPVPQTLKGAGGLTELDTLIVTGTVSEESTADNVVIEASGIFRKPS